MKKGVKALIIIGSSLAVVVGGFFGFLLITNSKGKVNETQWKTAFNNIYNTEKRNVRISIPNQNNTDIYCLNNEERCGNVYAKIDTDGKAKRYIDNRWQEQQLFTKDSNYMPAFFIGLENKYSDFKFNIINKGQYFGNIGEDTYIISFDSNKRLNEIVNKTKNSSPMCFEYECVSFPYFPQASI